MLRRTTATADAEDVVMEMDIDLEPATASASQFAVEDLVKGPGALAWELCEKHGLEEDPRRPVALVAVQLERCWQKLLQTSPELALPSSDVWPKHDGTKALLPPYGWVSRLLLLGGGGAGKTSRINLALSPWLRAFVGNRGLQKLAPSHKAARGILGETLHMANNLQGTSSMPTPHLRTQPRQQAFVRRQGRQGARIDDEFSQLNSRLLHADVYMTSVARELAWEAREQFFWRRLGRIPNRSLRATRIWIDRGVRCRCCRCG